MEEVQVGEGVGGGGCRWGRVLGGGGCRWGRSVRWGRV